MDAAEMERLAVRCEQAAGADRELGLAISIACDMESPHNDPTSSLDAAMTLIDRCGVLLHLSDIGADGLPLCNIGDSVTAKEFKGIATANLALAVCAAALRARAATGEQG